MRSGITCSLVRMRKSANDVKVGDNVIITAGALINKDVFSNSVVEDASKGDLVA
jgi:UDP-3-O-[3-hydroxymyristoyl] glucosamine N-acyltransferase